MEKNINLRKKSLFSYGFVGIVWVVFGIVQIIELPKYFKTVLMIVLLGMMSISICSHFMKSDKIDEMSKVNELKAQSTSYILLALFFSILLIISFFKNVWIVDLVKILPFLFGLNLMSKSLLFIFYEKAGQY
ncbi:hypothetical protein [Clostridium taeniosporum]|uniref:DUF2178 domain-containing protein n=1 Tax=Clostridium taeniosporum TaxID=394958 RepID=A0A1D7XKM3_9CLOT|nr:hypothetical protein [Clostridium taeniosporum]AOR23720.1 hypothetical protein BGI42_08235 [Clostridium taeniosporum]